jgi:RNA polymerase sigma factor (TIGR02999 family)
MQYDPGDITRLLSEVKAGNREAESKLMQFVYAELHRIAGNYMRRERPDHTLQPTALVHEAYLRMLGRQQTDWQNRAHFLALAANTMRRILVDYARTRDAAKRGGLQTRVPWDESVAEECDAQSAELIDLEAALQQLARVDERLSKIVELRYFGGLSVEETAEVLAVSPKTVKRDWSIAKAWLRNELGKGADRAPRAMA